MKSFKLNTKISRAIKRVLESYRSDNNPWIVGFSGGKDSTAVLKILFNALTDTKKHHKKVNIIYSNSGVDIPCMAELSMNVLKKFQKECDDYKLPININIIKPELSERYFVKIIGRGYPPPTDKFRWCTDRLLIRPLNKFLKQSEFQNETILLGVRRDESSARNLTLKESKNGEHFERTFAYLFNALLQFQS
ncbi:MAG: phosphoadenosine phosphosulfate reductase domain-containing protein [Planctomycetota bacterium]|jgi:DNA sulfur modification protein DndC